MKRSTRIRVVLGVVLATAMLGTASWAFFTTTGSGSGSAAVATLAAPTHLNVSQPDAGAGTVHLTWIAPAAPGGGAVDGYYLQRTGSTSGNACGSSATSLVTVASCNDTGLSAGTYTYTVTAVWRSWTATSAPSAPIEVTIVTTAGTSTSLTIGAASVSYGTPVNFTSTVSSDRAGTPTGTVTIKHSTTILCSITLPATSCSSTGFSFDATTVPYSITATYAGDTSFNSSTSAAQNLTVTQASQTINFTSVAPSNATVGGTYTVTATGGSSGNPVSFSIGSASSLVCSSSGSTVSFIASGTCVVNADQAAHTNYAAAPQLSQSFTVSTALVIKTATRENRGNTKVTFTGGGTPGASATITICTVKAFPCTSSAGTASVGSIGSNGNWTSAQSSTNLTLGAEYYSQAVQPDGISSPIFTFNVPS